MASFGIENISVKSVLNPFKEGDVSVCSAVVVSFKSRAAVSVRADNTDGLYL